jgi:pre-rRNA-processing protein TSR3
VYRCVLPKESSIPTPKLYVLMMRQDDPQKCTASKLARMRLAVPLYRADRIPLRSIVVNPFSPKIVSPSDRPHVEAYGLVAVDCSWEKADAAFAIHLPDSGRRLPTLLAANPTNYAKQYKLSSLEAMAATLCTTGFKGLASQLLSVFKWGDTFLTLNHEPLEFYSQAESEEEMKAAEGEFF